MQRLLFSFFTLFSFFEAGGGSGIVSIFLQKYDNPGGLGDNGNCCDGIRYICRGYCDHYFILCLDQPTGSPTNVRQCAIGRHTTGVTENSNSIRFSQTIGGKPNPTEFPIDKWEGSALVKVEVWDSDSNNNDFVELLSTTVQLQASRSRAEMREEAFQAKKRTQLDFYMSVFCDENWYGPRCDVHCQPSNGDAGHYECGENGTQICHPGWTGEDCKENIDECQSGPCSSPGGHCVDEINGYICVCQPGYTGRSCETQIDECVSQPCLNNATCQDLIGRFQCLCPVGYTGDLCDSEISYCASNPCGDGATCQEAVGNFRCLCPINATGIRCEIVLDNCGDNFCHNNGTCLDDAASGDIYCRCLDGWEGPDCIDNTDDCENITCPINMTCVDLVGGYECVCIGENCEGPAILCTPETCTNGGTCIDGELGYACICPNGFVGHHCQVVVANVTCHEHPCLNNGTCVALTGSATCHCPLGYSGKLCQNYDGVITTAPVDPCLSSPCYAQATCMVTSHGWECACPEDLMGPTCDTPTDNITKKIMSDNNRQCVQILSTGRTVSVNPQLTREARMDCTVQFQGDESLLANLVYWFKIQNLTIVEIFSTDTIISAKLNNQDTTTSGALRRAAEFTDQVSSLLQLQNPFDDTNKFTVTNAETATKTNTISLTVKNLDQTDSGLYVCAVKQTGNKPVLTVDYRLNVLQQVNEVMIRGHANYTLMRHMNMDNMNTLGNMNNVNNMNQGSSLIYYENTDGFFECKSEGGFPAPHLSIFIGEQRISGFGLNTEYTNYTLTGDLGGRKTIYPIRWVNSTNFKVDKDMNNLPIRCQAEVRTANSTFQNKTAQKTLIIYYKPRIECEESTIKIPLGGARIPVQCDIYARPVPEITWTAKDSKVDVKSNENNVNNLGLKAITETTESEDKVRATLTFDLVKQEHYQQYDIVAENDAGKSLLTVTMKDGELKLKEYNSASSLSSTVLLMVLVAALRMLFSAS